MRNRKLNHAHGTQYRGVSLIPTGLRLWAQPSVRRADQSRFQAPRRARARMVALTMIAGQLLADLVVFTVRWRQLSTVVFIGYYRSSRVWKIRRTNTSVSKTVYRTS